MDTTSAASMKQEMKEMALMLKEIRESALELIDPSNSRSSQRRRLTAEQKREKSTSSWAKSTSDRSRRLVTDKVPTPDNNIQADVAKSERIVSKRVASYTFGSRYPDIQKVASKDVIYDVKIECSSVRTRVKSCVFNKAVRLPTPKLSDPVCAVTAKDVEEKIASDPMITMSEKAREKDAENCSKPPKSTVMSQPSKAYSFSKSPRDAVSRSSTVGISGDGDVESAEKKLHPHIMGVVMRPPSSPSRIIEEIPKMQDSALEFLGTSDIIAYLDARSNGASTPTYSMNKDTVRTVTGILIKRKGTPGPGEYNPDIPSYSEPKGAVAYKEKSSVTPAYLLANYIAPRKETPGPGSYEVCTADDFRHEVISAKFSRLSEAKLTPHLARKKYWEDKASDARDENDDMCVVNDSILRSRVPIVVMWNKNVDLSPKRKQILRERQSEREKMNNGTTYEVSHSLVEKRVQGKVLMDREMQALASTRKSMAGKPGVLRVMTEREAQERDRDQFYGPNLPVAWGVDAVPPMGKKGSVLLDFDDDDDDAEDSPTEDIEKFFNRKNNSIKNQVITPLVSETAEAYLRSSAATGGVPLKSRFNMMIKDNPIPLRAALATSGVELEFLGPQLQMDWLSNPESKNKPVDLKFGLGRDEILVPKKGQVILNSFGDVAIAESEGSHLGPGVYDISKGRGIAEGGGGLGVPFSLAIPRKQRVGPNGEKPEYLEEDLADAVGDKYFKEVMLALDYSEAKSAGARIKGVELYKRDRNEPGDPFRLPVQDILGGEHFQGMAELVQKQRSTVDVTKMTGRNDNTDPYDDEQGNLGQILGLNISDPKPDRARSKGFLFSDPDKNPRFENLTLEGGQDEKLLDLIVPQYNALNSPSILVDMSKQSGRDLSLPGIKRVDEVDVFVTQDALGSEDPLLSMQIAVEKDKAVERGLALSSNQRKTPAFNMNHQSGRAGVVPGSGALELDENGHVIDEKHVLDLDVKDNKTGWNKSAGVEDWKRQKGRDTDNKGTEEHLGTVLESEELILEPLDVASSKHKRGHVGVSWAKDSMPRMEGNDDIQRETNADEDGRRYTDDEAKSGNEGTGSGRGMKSVAWKKGESQSRDVGRVSAAELMKELMLSDPQAEGQTLDLNPELTTQSKYKRVQVGPSWTSAAP